MVMVSMTWPSVKLSPCQWKCLARSWGAFVTREPTMNRSPASSIAVRFVFVMALIEIPQSCSSEFLRSRGQVSAGSCRS
ncbi:hypothetical protein ACFPRL_01155 [Pseudoclavibacter helvolus]